MLDFVKSVEYCVGLNFGIEKGSLVLIDESDIVMFDSPQNFCALIDGKVCICLTATPSNCKEDGVEAQVIEALGFDRFSYIVEEDDAQSIARLLAFDEVSEAATAPEKIDYIKSLLL